MRVFSSDAHRRDCDRILTVIVGAITMRFCNRTISNIAPPEIWLQANYPVRRKDSRAVRRYADRTASYRVDNMEYMIIRETLNGSQTSLSSILI